MHVIIYHDILCSYLAELTRIASSYGAITRQTQLQMRKVPLLLGSRRAVDDVSTDPAGGHNDEKREPEYQLLLPSQVSLHSESVRYESLTSASGCYCR